MGRKREMGRERKKLQFYAEWEDVSSPSAWEKLEFLRVRKQRGRGEDSFVEQLSL